VSYGCLFGCQLLDTFKFKVFHFFYDGEVQLLIKWGFGGFDRMFPRTAND